MSITCISPSASKRGTRTAACLEETGREGVVAKHRKLATACSNVGSPGSGWRELRRVSTISSTKIAWVVRRREGKGA